MLPIIPHLGGQRIANQRSLPPPLMGLALGQFPCFLLRILHYRSCEGEKNGEGRATFVACRGALLLTPFYSIV